MTDFGYYPTHPNLNDQMTPKQHEEFRRFMQTGEGVAEISDNGQTIEFVFPDQPISQQSVKESLRRRAEAEYIVDNYVPQNPRHLGDEPAL